MSDDTSDDAPSQSPASRSGRPASLRTLRRATRWETFALLVVLLVLAFAFA
ncbi:hypothetical protein J1792_31975 [Streptomyces triculaminicus]|uniref:Uncharacterized protein n=1 Tax=Streptomyces triculaminicus TaxID=2816232 RepID=A0A939FUR5_9ACTN|nr:MULTISPECIES: hypothetical protein [Streptomyces]MBO0657169.1 hypothetical protein [Streptomyces triculaminicus]